MTAALLTLNRVPLALGTILTTAGWAVFFMLAGIGLLLSDGGPIGQLLVILVVCLAPGVLTLAAGAALVTRETRVQVKLVGRLTGVAAAVGLGAAVLLVSLR